MTNESSTTHLPTSAAYTTCPRCAKAYGTSYVVRLADVAPLPDLASTR